MEFFRGHILICSGTGCISSGANTIKDAFVSELKIITLIKSLRLLKQVAMVFVKWGPLH